MKLGNGFPVRYAVFGDDVLAGVVAFLGASPEEKSAVEGCIAARSQEVSWAVSMTNVATGVRRTEMWRRSRN